MRTVRMPALGRDVSALGFGCASLGSRVSAKVGARAIDQALELGVDWFDVAPPYGDGQAEAILGKALRGRRDRVVICTKFGIPRPSISTAKRLLRPLARGVIAAFPASRRAISRARSIGHGEEIDPTKIETSLATSLRLLQTDYIDVLALHEPHPKDAASEEIFAVLSRLKSKGMVRALSVAGSPSSIEAAIASGRPIDAAQFSLSSFDQATERLLARPPGSPLFLVTHGVFTPPTVAALGGAAASNATSTADPSLSLRHAFSVNPEGVVITSMFKAAHIVQNVRVASQLPAQNGLDLVSGLSRSA